MKIHSGVVLLMHALAIQVHDVASDYILPAMGLGGEPGDTNTGINLLISHLNAAPISVTGKVEHNDTCVAIRSDTLDAGIVSTMALANFEDVSLLNRSELANKSIEVTEDSGTNKPFNLHVIYEKNGHSEGYAAISTDDVGNEYYVSTFCALGGYCQIAIAPVEVGLTLVYVKLPAEVNEVVICMGELYWRSGFHTTFNITYPETLQIETAHDLTGTYIYSDNPVSVIAGTRSMPNNIGMPLHFMEQLVPVSHWGTEFIVSGYKTAYGCILHITSKDRKTIVEMTGFKTVELTGSGKTLKRRLEDTSSCHIRSSKPIQVMMYVGITYGSNEVISSVGMTTIPAMEHYKTRYLTYCLSSANTYFQYVLNSDESVTQHVGSVSSKIFATEYSVNTVNITSANEDLQTTMTTPFGGIFQCGTAVFPLAPPLTTPVGCTEDIAGMIYNDGIDNDCDGLVDEDYCFENSKLIFTFIPDVTEQIPSYTSDVTDFYEILLRVQSCGPVQVELNDGLDWKVVLHISTSQLVLYLCSPSCNVFHIQNTTLELSEINCESDVISYWIMQHSGTLCIGIGRRNLPGNCTNVTKPMTLQAGLVEMRISGLMNNATIWWDLYKTDCGPFVSDWRCHDAVRNCFEYNADLCTNPAYEDWVELHCKKYCGRCSPDSFGQMFIFTATMPLSYVTNSVQLRIVGENMTSSRIGVGSTDHGIHKTATFMSLEQRNINNVSCFKSDLNGLLQTFYIFTENETAVYRSSLWNSLSARVLLPFDALGTEYMTMTFDNELVCIATATEPGSTLTIYMNGVTNKYSHFQEETVFITSNATGVLFTGNKPFAVFCGTMATAEYGPSWYQLPPTRTWGTYYVTPSIGSNYSSEVRGIIKVVANSNSTAIEIHGDFDGIYLLLERGDSKEFPSDPSISYNISSNNPVGVAIIFYELNTKVNSSFVIVPPTESFMENPGILGFTDFIDAVTSLTSTPSIGNVAEYTFNDTDLPHGDFYFKDYYSSSFLLFVREYPERFDVTPSLSLFKDLTRDQICRPGNNNVGDGVDTDCDGLADEETICYSGYGSLKQDADLDGDFGEDCASLEIGSSNITVPAEPICGQVIEITNSSCWLVCKCSCAWAAQLEQYQNMTKTEQDAYNQAKADHYKQELKVNEETLSATVAAKVSAEDKRTSSQSIGMVGCVFIAIVFGFVVSFDMINVVNKIREKMNRGEVKEINK